MGGKSSRKLKAIQKLESLVNDIDNDLIDTLLEESDRGFVLVSASFIEESLEHYLRFHLNESATDEKDVDLLLGSALGSFHNRILAISALGLADRGLIDAILEFKELRNAFAHRKSNSTRPEISAELSVKILNLATGQKAKFDTEAFGKARERVGKKTSARLAAIVAEAEAHPNNTFYHLYHADRLLSEAKPMITRIYLMLFVVYILEMFKTKN